MVVGEETKYSGRDAVMYYALLLLAGVCGGIVIGCIAVLGTFLLGFALGIVVADRNAKVPNPGEFSYAMPMISIALVIGTYVSTAGMIAVFGVVGWVVPLLLYGALPFGFLVSAAWGLAHRMLVPVHQ